MTRTTRLELDDATLREWDATVLDVTDDGVVLDRSAFYPSADDPPPATGGYGRPSSPTGAAPRVRTHR